MKRIRSAARRVVSAGVQEFGPVGFALVAVLAVVALVLATFMRGMS